MFLFTLVDSCKFVAIQASLALNIVLWSDASSLFHRVK